MIASNINSCRKVSLNLICHSIFSTIGLSCNHWKVLTLEKTSRNQAITENRLPKLLKLITENPCMLSCFEHKVE